MHMNKIKHEESVIVFSYKDTNTLLKFNGSQSWKLDSRRISKCKYIICVIYIVCIVHIRIYK